MKNTRHILPLFLLLLSVVLLIGCGTSSGSAGLSGQAEKILEADGESNDGIARQGGSSQNQKSGSNPPDSVTDQTTQKNDTGNRKYTFDDDDDKYDFDDKDDADDRYDADEKDDTDDRDDADDKDDTDDRDDAVGKDDADDRDDTGGSAISQQASLLDKDASYTTKEDVALYLHIYGTLPENFITKKEAKSLGWTSGSLEPYAPGKCIGGDRFGNYEGLLPEEDRYRECDIDTLGADSRGAKRIVYSDDGDIYYTDDHYKSFEQLYDD